MAASYQVSIGQLRTGNTELAAAGHLMQARRPIGRSAWQHLILVTDRPGELPAEHEAWALLDAALAAETATDPAHDPGDIYPESAHVATCGDATEHQVATCAGKPHIEPVNCFPSDHTDHKPVVVRTVADLKALAALPPLPAPEEQRQFWLTPGQVLSLHEPLPAPVRRAGAAGPGPGRGAVVPGAQRDGADDPGLQHRPSGPGAGRRARGRAPGRRRPLAAGPDAPAARARPHAVGRAVHGHPGRPAPESEKAAVRGAAACRADMRARGIAV